MKFAFLVANSIGWYIILRFNKCKPTMSTYEVWGSTLHLTGRGLDSGLAIVRGVIRSNSGSDHSFSDFMYLANQLMRARDRTCYLHDT